MPDSISIRVGSSGSLAERLPRAATLDGPAQRFVSDSLWLTGSGVLYGLLQWLFVLMIAKFCSQISFGQYVYVTAITTPIFALAHLNLKQLYLSRAEPLFTASDYIVLRCVGVACAALATLAIAYLQQQVVPLGIVIAITAIKSIDGVTDILFGVLQRAHKTVLVAGGMCLNGVLSLLVGSASVVSGGSIESALAASATCSVIALIPIAVACRGAMPYQGDSAGNGVNWRHLLRRALPVGCSNSLSTLHPQIPRYLLQQSSGVALATYGAAVTLLAPVDVLASAMTQAATVAFSQSGSEYHELNRRLCRVMVLMCIAVVGGGILALPTVIVHTFGPKYEISDGALGFLCLSSGISLLAVPRTSMAIVRGAGRRLVPANALALAAGLACGIPLIDAAGVAGASLTVALMATVKVVALVVTDPNSTGARTNKAGS
jgi:O-antigen/teichoic acid export membrane protein